MREYLKSSSFRVLLITIVVLLGLLIVTAAAGSSFLASVFGFVSSPMQGVAANVTEEVTEFLDLDSLSKEELKETIQALLDEKARLQSRLVDYDKALEENQLLRQQLELENQRPENQLIGAVVIGRDPNDMFYGFSIDKGSLDGVQVGDPVISKRGLVGMVTQTYATGSKVTSLLSEDVKVAAVCVQRRESGVIASDITTASAGLLRMNYLSSDSQLQPGDIIVTSGAGGDYPQDILIGEVRSVEKSENDISKYAVIQPSEDLTDLQEVFVVVSFPGKGEAGPQETDPESEPGEEDME